MESSCHVSPMWLGGGDFPPEGDAGWARGLGRPASQDLPVTLASCKGLGCPGDLRRKLPGSCPKGLRTGGGAGVRGGGSRSLYMRRGGGETAGATILGSVVAVPARKGPRWAAG